MTKQEIQPPSFVIAATLAGHLYRMTLTAKLMLISASNAKGVAARIGGKALGFRPITDFIVEMANNTIAYANKINQLALSVSRISVVSMRTADGQQRFSKAQKLLSDATQTTFIDQLIQTSRDAQHDMDLEINSIIAMLELQLDEVSQCVRGSTIVISNSRTEASRAGEFRPYLDSIADNVELATDELRREIVECRLLIDKLTVLPTSAGSKNNLDTGAL